MTTKLFSRKRAGVALLTLALGALTLACSDVPSAAEPDGALRADAAAAAAAARPSGENASVARNAAEERVERQLAELRRATAEFHRPEQAEAAGYTVLVTHPVSGAACLADPEQGGMGRHLLKPARIDDEVLVTEPEALIYEPDPNGALKLVGVEYVIPFEIRGTEESAPVLFGQELKQNFTFNLWALHVWPWKHNPSGMFADWNPSVSCEHDGHVAPS